MYTLNELANEGHTYAQREQLIKKGMSLLDAKEPAIETALEKMLADNDLILDGDAIYLPPFFYDCICIFCKINLVCLLDQSNIFFRNFGYSLSCSTNGSSHCPDRIGITT